MCLFHGCDRRDMLLRRRKYLFGSNSITYNYTNDKIKQISRARLPENPEVNHAGHPNIQFLDYHETTTTTTILLKNTQRHKYRKKWLHISRWWAVVESGFIYVFLRTDDLLIVSQRPDHYTTNPPTSRPASRWAKCNRQTSTCSVVHPEQGVWGGDRPPPNGGGDVCLQVKFRPPPTEKLELTKNLRRHENAGLHLTWFAVLWASLIYGPYSTEYTNRNSYSHKQTIKIPMAVIVHTTYIQGDAN